MPYKQIVSVLFLFAYNLFQVSSQNQREDLREVGRTYSGYEKSSAHLPEVEYVYLFLLRSSCYAIDANSVTFE